MVAGDDAGRLLLGLVGAGLSLSRSPAMHEAEAVAHGLRCVYQRIDLSARGLSPDELPRVLDAAELMGFAGLNITHPCKQTVRPLLSRVDRDADRVGAVNTVVFRGGERVGYNTDWVAFRRALAETLPGAPMERVVQLGAGGAGAATAYALLDLGVARLAVSDVVPGRAHELASRLQSWFPGRVAATDDVKAVLHEAHGLVHATPTGMSSHPGVPLDVHWLRPDVWVAEVVYFPLETDLLRAARARGCRTVDGSGMAIYQAVEAFRLFTGRPASADRMRAAFEAAARVSPVLSPVVPS